MHESRRRAATELRLSLFSLGILCLEFFGLSPEELEVKTSSSSILMLVPLEVILPDAGISKAAGTAGRLCLRRRQFSSALAAFC